jgi:DNA polymerase elongation subunit (family B)
MELVSLVERMEAKILKHIELRRHDCPIFVKRFQNKILKILLDAETAENVGRTQLQKAYDYVVETCDRVLTGEIEPEDLAVSKVLRKPVSKYKSIFPHVAAAIQLVQKGKKVKTGEGIDFLYLNAGHMGPFKRVIPVALSTGHFCYDKKKYLELVRGVGFEPMNP